MNAVTSSPKCTQLISKTPRIHMRNAYSLSQIGKRHNAQVTINNLRSKKSATVDDVFSLMLLEVKLNDALDVEVHILDPLAEMNTSVDKIIEEIKDVFLTP